MMPTKQVRPNRKRQALLVSLTSLHQLKVEKERRRRMERAFRRYVAACGGIGENVEATPTYIGVMGYIVQYVNDAGGSTLSVFNALSDLRNHFAVRGEDWLTPTDQGLVKRALDLLCLADTTSVSRQSEAFTRGILLRFLDTLDLTKTADLALATLCFVCHDGLLRAGELFCGLLVKDFKWSLDRTSVKVLFMRTKTHRSGNAIEIELVDPGEGNICAVSLLRKWFDRLDLWRQPEAPAFPAVRKSRNGGGRETVLRDKHFSRWTWSDRVKKILIAVGLEPRLYSDHGFRAGGATDLFDAGMTLTEVMEFGRWKTAKSCLRYYRRGYGLANKVAAAFIGHSPKTLWEIN